MIRCAAATRATTVWPAAGPSGCVPAASTPHFHSKGWLSSACHIELPSVVDGDGKEGWLAFGAPAFEGVQPLPPDHYEKPQPGRLVLFPSYMWHGTVPFSGTESRLTIAFDVVPA